MPLIDFVLHIDDHLVTIVQQFGNWTYVLFFLVLFVETGLVVFPFLPGDSLIFAAAAMAANPRYQLNIWLSYLIFVLAAIIGDSVNYEIGRWSAEKGHQHSWFTRLVNQEKQQAAENFFKRHGGKTIFLGRFIPFIRTFVPFISGASQMAYPHFITYNVLGAIVWVLLFSSLGYFFGNISFVQNHFSLLVIAIVLISLIPIGIIWLKKKLVLKKTRL